MSWVQQDLSKAREGLKRIRGTGGDPYARMSQKLLDDGVGPLPTDPTLGYIANIIRAEPGIVQRIRDEGFDARVNETANLNENPYNRDGEYGWWRQGWLTADDNL